MTISGWPPGFDPDEIRTDQPAGAARLKWVIVVDAGLPTGLLVNAAACMAAAVGRSVAGLIGPPGHDGTGRPHAGLPWAGCSILAGDTDTIRDLRDRAGGRDDLLVGDMPQSAQTSRVYDDYLVTLAATDAASLSYYAVSVLGPRDKIDKLVGKLPLLR
jgi:hypothetical protein